MNRRKRASSGFRRSSKHSSFARDTGVADAFDFDDVLYFVRDDDEVFVRRWSEGMVIDIDDAAFVDVDWRATTKLNGVRAERVRSSHRTV